MIYEYSYDDIKDRLNYLKQTKMQYTEAYLSYQKVMDSFTELMRQHHMTEIGENYIQKWSVVKSSIDYADAFADAMIQYFEEYIRSYGPGSAENKEIPHFFD